MAIVKMKRIRLFGMADHREDLLKQLQHLGCVEISEPADKLADPDWAVLTRVHDAGLAQAKADAAQLNAALTTLKRFAKEKGSLFTPRPEITAGQLFDENVRASAMAAAQAVNAQEKRIASIQSEQSKLRSQKATLAPWLELNTPLETTGTRSVSATFGALMATAALGEVRQALEQEASELAELILAGKDREFQYVLVLCHRSAEEDAFEALKKFGFSRASLRGWTGTARENTDRLDAELLRLEEELKAAKAAIVAQAEHRSDIKRSIDRMTQDIQREEVKHRLLESQRALFLEGWVPVPDLEKLEAALAGFVCAWQTEDPAQEEYPTVPIKLKNNALTRPLNMVTEMYSLPSYDGIDPNPLIMPFFVFFFGFMFADLGYGIILILASLLVRKKARPKGGMKNMMELLTEVGIASAVIGFLTGGFFSDSIATVSTLLNITPPVIPFLSAPAGSGVPGPLLDVMNDPLTTLVFCMAIGAVQLVVGMAVSVYLQVRDGKWLDALCNEVTWWVVFICLGVSAVTGNWNIMLGALVLLLLTQGHGKKGIGGKLGGILGSLYNNVTGYFGDILSYSRLMVMMLAGSVIGSIFNLLGSMPGSMLVFIPIFVLGHVFNMGLNIIGTYVHSARLQYLEFFGKFYREGGRPFRPLGITTKYVDMIEEES